MTIRRELIDKLLKECRDPKYIEDGNKNISHEIYPDRRGGVSSMRGGDYRIETFNG